MSQFLEHHVVRSRHRNHHTEASWCKLLLAFYTSTITDGYSYTSPSAKPPTISNTHAVCVSSQWYAYMTTHSLRKFFSDCCFDGKLPSEVPYWISENGGLRNIILARRFPPATMLLRNELCSSIVAPNPVHRLLSTTGWTLGPKVLVTLLTACLVRISICFSSLSTMSVNISLWSLFSVFVDKPFVYRVDFVYSLTTDLIKITRILQTAGGKACRLHRVAERYEIHIEKRPLQTLSERSSKTTTHHAGHLVGLRSRWCPKRCWF